MEGGSPLILSCYFTSTKLEAHLFSPNNLKHVHSIIPQALGILNEAELLFITSKNENETSKNTAKINFDIATDALQNLIAQKTSCTKNGISSRGRIVVSTARVIDENALDVLKNQIVEAKETLRKKKDVLLEANKDLDRFTREYDAWKNQFPHRDENTLIAYCQDLVKPVLTYYKNLFFEDRGNTYHMRKADLSCQLFDPIFLQEKQNYLHRLYYLADQLIHFRYPHSTTEFIAILKRGIPLAINHSNMYFDWN